MEATITVSGSKNMFSCPSGGWSVKTLQPGELKFMCHLIADPDKDDFLKKPVVTCK
jgi:hypothetical protein